MRDPGKIHPCCICMARLTRYACFPFYKIAQQVVGRCSLAIMPVFFVALAFSLIMVTYFLDVYYQKTSPAWLPMISDTGNYPPASMVFSLNAGLSALLVGIIALAVYQFYEACIKVQKLKEIRRGAGDTDIEEVAEKRANKRSVYNAMLLFSASISVIGLVALAAFQLNHAYKIHAAGFVILAANSYIYFGGLTQFSNKWLTGIMFERKRRITLWLRITLISFGCLCLVGFFGLTFLIWNKYAPADPCPEDVDWRIPQNCSDPRKNYKPEDGGYDFYVIGNVCEWLWLMTLFALFLSLASELSEEPSKAVVRNVLVKWKSVVKKSNIPLAKNQVQGSTDVLTETKGGPDFKNGHEEKQLNNNNIV